MIVPTLIVVSKNLSIVIRFKSPKSRASGSSFASYLLSSFCKTVISETSGCASKISSTLGNRASIFVIFTSLKSSLFNINLL